MAGMKFSPATSQCIWDHHWNYYFKLENYMILLEILHKLVAVNLCSLLSQTHKNVFIYLIAIILLWNVWITWLPLSSLFMTLALFLLIMVAISRSVFHVKSDLNARVYLCACWQNTKHTLWEHTVEQIPEDSNTWWCPSACYSSLFLMNMLSQEWQSSCFVLILLICCMTIVDMKMWARWIQKSTAVWKPLKGCWSTNE